MRVDVKLIDGKYRIVDPVTEKPAVHARTGAVLDGGGHADKDKAVRQAGHINGTQPSSNP